MLHAFLSTVPALSVIAIAGVYIILLWRFFDWRTKGIDDWHELFCNNNVALLCQRLGLLAGQGIAMSAVVTDFDFNDPWGSAGHFAIEGAWVFVAMIGAYVFVDKLIFPKINNTSLLIQGNAAVGIVELAAYIGIGFLIKGSLTGTASSTILSVASTVVFYLAGLAVVTLIFYVHEFMTPYSLRDKLKDGDLAAAIELGGVFIGVSVVTRVGVAGDFVDWSSAFAWFGATVAVSLVSLYVLRWITNRLFFRRNTIKEAQRRGSPTAAAFQAGIMILAASAVAALMSL